LGRGRGGIWNRTSDYIEETNAERKKRGTSSGSCREKIRMTKVKFHHRGGGGVKIQGDPTRLDASSFGSSRNPWTQWQTPNGRFRSGQYRSRFPCFWDWGGVKRVRRGRETAFESAGGLPQRQKREWGENKYRGATGKGTCGEKGKTSGPGRG